MRNLNDDVKFLIDILTNNEEKSFLAELEENPLDKASRNAYMDWLRENGRDDTADMVSKGYIPGSEKSYIYNHISGVGFDTINFSGGYHPLVSGQIQSGAVGGW